MQNLRLALFKWKKTFANSTSKVPIFKRWSCKCLFGWSSMGTEHIVLFSKDRDQIWSEVADFCASCKSTHVTKWSGHLAHLHVKSLDVGIFNVGRILWSSTRTNGQLRSPTGPRGRRKIMKIDSKACFPQKGGDGFPENVLSLGTFGEKNPKVSI